jgi:hypothetical protein
LGASFRHGLKGSIGRQLQPLASNRNPRQTGVHFDDEEIAGQSTIA